MKQYHLASSGVRLNEYVNVTLNVLGCVLCFHGNMISITFINQPLTSHGQQLH